MKRVMCTSKNEKDNTNLSRNVSKLRVQRVIAISLQIVYIKIHLLQSHTTV